MISRKRRTKRKKNPQIGVSWEFVPAPDAEARLAQVYSLLLQMGESEEVRGNKARKKRSSE
jgi:hypothetical protein